MQDYITIIGVLRFRKDKPPRSYRETRARFNLGAGTVQLIEERFDTSGLTLEEAEKLEPDQLIELIYPEETIRRKHIELPDYEKVYHHIHSKKRSTLYLEWTEYKKENPDGYQYTQFCRYYREYVRTHYGEDLSMAINRIPGEKLFIDWVGERPKLVLDSETQKLKEAHFFVTTIGLSNLMYVKAYPDEKLPNFVDGTKCALEYYGGVPKYLVPDNLKAAITKHTKDELIINSVYQDLENFYDLIILPHPPVKPTGKATAERYVRFVETRMIPELSKDIYPSFEALNNRIIELNDRYNLENNSSTKISKKETFENYDKPEMKPLPKTSFSLFDYRFISKVPNNYHVDYDGHYYSIPFSYAGKSVIVKASFSEIRITDENNRLIHSHFRSYKPFPKYITVDEHMPSNHQYWKQVNEATTETFLTRAKRIGPHMERFIMAVLHSFRHEEQSYNSINGILHQCDGLSYVICDEIARSCLESGRIGYTYFKKELSDMAKRKQSNDTLPSHSNIRGKDYYK